MNQEEKVWLNQSLIYHKDNIYNSNGTLEVSLSSSTADYKNFSTLNLNLSIVSNNRRVCIINFQNAVDLINSIKSLMKDENYYKNSEIVKKYYTDRTLKFEFKELKNEVFVAISITFTNSDFSRVIVPTNIFTSFCNILKSYVTDYIKLNFDIVNRTILSEVFDQIKEIKNSIRVLPSMINQDSSKNNTTVRIEEDQIYNLEIDSVLKNRVESVTNIEAQLDDLDKFLGKDMQNIKLEEIKDVVEKSLDIHSELVDMFKNNLKEVEDFLTSISMEKNPFKVVEDKFSSIFDVTLPGLKEEDHKSISYISKVIYDSTLRKYINDNVPILSSFPILKYNTNHVNVNNIELVYDLLLISIYSKILRNRLESRESDAFKNRSIFNMGIRCFFDPFIFSFLGNNVAPQIKSIISSKYKSYKQKGFFKEYEKELDLYSLQMITEKEIVESAEILLTKVIEKSSFIEKLHQDTFEGGNLRLPYENNFNEEQIINWIVPIEVYEKLGVDVKDENELYKVVNIESVPKEILKIFKEGIKVKQVRKPKLEESNILRFVRTNTTSEEIPERLKQEFIDYLNEVKYDIIDLDKFPLEEFGEGVVKAIYEWNECSNKNEPYTSFYTRFESSIITKDVVIVKIKTQKSINNTVKESWVGFDEL